MNTQQVINIVEHANNVRRTTPAAFQETMFNETLEALGVYSQGRTTRRGCQVVDIYTTNDFGNREKILIARLPNGDRVLWDSCSIN